MRDKCGLKFPRGWNAHRRNPNVNAAPQNTIIYLTADPFDTILSFDRRGFFGNAAHCRHMGGDVPLLNKIKKDGGLKGLGNYDKDPFGMEEHLRNWMGFDQRTYDLLIVKYEHLAEHIPDILEFFKVYREDRVGEFRKSYIPRNARWDEASDDVKQSIERIYGEYREWWLTLDSKMFFPRKG